MKTVTAKRDRHISIAGLLLSSRKPLMDMAATLIAICNGSRSTAAKTRANGLKGGRLVAMDTIIMNMVYKTIWRHIASSMTERITLMGPFSK